MTRRNRKVKIVGFDEAGFYEIEVEAPPKRKLTQLDDAGFE